IASDGSFHLGGLPSGMAIFSLNEQLKGFKITRVEREGIVQSRGVEIKEGEQVTGVRVIVSYGKATLRGVVVLENGPLPAGGVGFFFCFFLCCGGFFFFFCFRVVCVA